MYKKAQLVMLPTDEKANVGSIVTRPSDNKMAIVNVLTKDDPQPCVHQHLYILSDEEIKEGDWCISDNIVGKVIKNFGNNLCEIDCNWSNTQLKSSCKKIIATTDISLKFGEDIPGIVKFKSLPQPSQQFIEHFVSEYNKGNVITEVMVEYLLNETGNYREFDICPELKEKLKINPDNTINIKPIKDSWNREEIKHLLECAWNGGAFWGSSKPNSHYFDKWIEENL